MDKVITINVSDIKVAIKIKGFFEKSTMELNLINDEVHKKVYNIYTVIIENETIGDLNETLRRYGLGEYCCREQEPFVGELPF